MNLGNMNKGKTLGQKINRVNEPALKASQGHGRLEINKNQASQRGSFYGQYFLLYWL